MGAHPPDLERILAQLHDELGGIRPETLSAAYLAALAEIEQQPCNQDGQDKSWVVESQQRWLDTIKNSRLVG